MTWFGARAGLTAGRAYARELRQAGGESSSQNRTYTADAQGTNNQRSSAGSSRNDSLDPQEAMQLLEQAIKRLKDREDSLLTKMKNLTDEAREKYRNDDMIGALNCMKEKRMLEPEVVKTGNLKITVKQQMILLESAIENEKTFADLRVGCDTMRSMRNMVGATDSMDNFIGKLREDVQAAMEVNQVVSMQMDATAVDDKLLAELEELSRDDDPEIPDSLTTTTTTASQAPTATMPPIARSQQTGALLPALKQKRPRNKKK